MKCACAKSATVSQSEKSKWSFSGWMASHLQPFSAVTRLYCSASTLTYSASCLMCPWFPAAPTWMPRFLAAFRSGTSGAGAGGEPGGPDCL